LNDYALAGNAEIFEIRLEVKILSDLKGTTKWF